jgi:subtilisin family serine protease
MRKILPLIFLLVYLKGYSQPLRYSSAFADPFLPGTIQIMLHSGNVTNEDTLKKRLSVLLKDYGFAAVTKRFPRAKKPRSLYSPQGEKYADLSGLYTLRIAEDAAVEKAVSLLKKQSWIKFAEPHFIPTLCYVPNDDSTGVQYALTRINAYAAWDIQKGDTTVLIGITDTGHEPLHPDLNANIQRNWSDPLNGLDDDQDGYVDNFTGWDTGSDDNDPSVDASYHGIHVTGLCCAVTDNQTGMAGTAFNSRYMHIKIANAQGILNGAYEGLIYAADHGCKVINCSWGGAQFSDINQELVRYAAVNRNCVVVCGAGNNNNEKQFYPAAYPYALSVGSSDLRDTKPEFSSYGYYLDLVAPGDNVLSTWINGSYVKSGGTSMSAPVVAGAAALLRSAFPQWNSRQIAEQLKISTDPIDTLEVNAAYRNKLGEGRLNMLRALTLGGRPAVVLTDLQAKGSGAGRFIPGDTVSLWGILINYLAPAPNVKLTISTESNAVMLINPAKNIGAMGNLASRSLEDMPFVLVVKPEAGINETVILKLRVEAAGYLRDQYIYLPVYSDVINVETSAISASFGSEGSAGITSGGFIKAYGFRYLKSDQLLYEGGLMLGAAGRGVADNIRGVAGDTDELRAELVLTRRNLPAAAPEEYRGTFSSKDSGIPVSVEQRIIVSKAFENRHFMLAEYVLNNTSDVPLTNFYAGIFCDWDLADPAANRAGWNQQLSMAYVHTLPLDTLYTATRLLGGTAAGCYNIDNIPGGEGGLNLADGFTDEEKYFALTNLRTQAGSTANGNDVITIISGGPFELQPGEKIRFPVAFLAAPSLQELNKAAAQAEVFYRQTALPLGMNQLAEKPNCRVFPNPSNGSFTIQSDGLQLHDPPGVFDLQGRSVAAEFQKTAEGWNVQLSEKTSGLILLRLMTPSGWHYERIQVDSFK